MEEGGHVFFFPLLFWLLSVERASRGRVYIYVIDGWVTVRSKAVSGVSLGLGQGCRV